MDGEAGAGISYLGGLNEHVWPNLAESTIVAVTRYLRERRPLSIADGTGVVGALESRLEESLGLSNVLSTSSGTAALHSAYMALDLPPGSEVVAPVLGFHASVTPALHCGLTARLVDVEPDTGNMDVDALVDAINPRTSCVVVNHMWGHPAEIDTIAEVCRNRGIALVEDCSHAYGSRLRGEPVGTFGDIAAFSMQASKTLAVGEGGFLATPRRDLFERACLAGHYRGRSYTQVTDPALRAYAESGFGLKLRLAPLLALIAYEELQHLPARLASRRDLLRRFDAVLQDSPGVRPPTVRGHVEIGGWFAYRPEFVPGELVREGVPLNCDDYIGLLRAAKLDAHRPSVSPLDELAIFRSTPPVRWAQETWRPSLAEDYPGCRQYLANRFTLPPFTAPELAPLVEQYCAVIRQVGSAFSTGTDEGGQPRELLQ